MHSVYIQLWPALDVRSYVCTSMLRAETICLILIKADKAQLQVEYVFMLVRTRK